MQEAWKYNRECKLLRDTLQSFSWNGEELSLPWRMVLMAGEGGETATLSGNRNKFIEFVSG